ncbi:amidohydrolase [Emticicia sp. 21SJ11W-3]|uniref:amidohydrolase family protein n=1 Tax=Emticicia sp. 21SJ11W-3 TaxID=2916755 RepID=UPI00209D82A2|nr:amidohydrolase family protein [Emticicia sp. 21SJ11W-3]UTA69272.1 amidohydrolase family protein [Emticicia sp. 21SJ11W-3]
MTIDAHQHFWHYNAKYYAWIDESMKAIQRDFLPADLEPLLNKNGIDGCVLVQVNQSEQENIDFLKFADLYSFIKGVVGWIDLRADNLAERLKYFSQFQKLKGFRHIVQGEPVGFMQQESFIDGVKKLVPFGYTYDILIYPKQLKDALHIVRECPDNKFVIDHIAKPDIKNKEVSRWSNYMKEIARHEQVYCKVSGMVTEADWYNWKKEDFYIYLDTVLDCFGTNRLMYGSDWPVCLVAGAYEDQLSIVQSYFEKLTQTEKDKIFGENAVRFYGLQ